MSVKSPTQYRDGENRYVNFAQDFIGVRLAEVQKRFLKALNNHQRILIISGNGVGKSYIVAISILAFLYTNPDSTVLGTSGSYSQFVDTMWRPLSELHRNLKEEHGLPGEVYHGNQPRLEVEGADWYAKVVSPRDPGDLEGRHAENILVVIEESDKRYIGEEHFDSAGSSITDTNDRMIAVANPPEDEANVVYKKMTSDRWTVIQFDSFQSHNVQVDLGATDEPKLPGLVDLITIADDWEQWNKEPWPNTPDDWTSVDDLKDRLDHEELIERLKPGVDAARTAHQHRTDLDKRWYRRRAGVIPPAGAREYRPFSAEEVEAAYNRNPTRSTEAAQGVGIDVARMGGDSNVLAGKHGDELRIHEEWSGVDHSMGKEIIRNYMKGWGAAEVAIDAQGEGSGLADEIKEFVPNRIRFRAGETATMEKEFYDKWTEALYEFGKFLREGGAFSSDRLREELLIASRVISFEEKHYASRDSTVLKASSKDKIKEALGKSPDALDAGLMAVWSDSESAQGMKKVQLLTW